MSTPRRTWFKLPDSIYREEWSNQVLATVVRLQAYMHERWARDDPEDAATVVIGPKAAMSITGFGRAHVALQALSRLPLEAGWTSASARLETVKGVSSVVLNCPKVAEFHGWTSRRVPERRPKNAPSEIEIENETKRREEQESSPERSDAQKPSDSPLLNLLSAYGHSPPPGKDEAAAWLDTVLVEIEAASESELPDESSKRQRGALAKKITIARWKKYLAGERRFRGHSERKRMDQLRREAQERFGPAYEADRRSTAQ